MGFDFPIFTPVPCGALTVIGVSILPAVKAELGKDLKGSCNSEAKGGSDMHPRVKVS